MCGACGYSVKDENLGYKRFGVAPSDVSLKPRYNIRPGQTLPVVVQRDHKQLVLMLWGLIPQWAKDKKFMAINAKAETVAEKAMFKIPLQSSRCLVPATHFYEWSGEKGHKQPYLFKLKQEAIFSFAGLYNTWHDPQTDKDIHTYTILTTTPNDVVKPIHDRMPVILSREHEETWLNPDVVEPEKLLPLLSPYPASDMISYPVSPLVNSFKNDSEQVIQPL